MDDDRILHAFQKAYPFFEEETLLKLAGAGQTTVVPRKGHLIRRNRVDRRIGIVLEGLFKGTILHDGEEQILWFSNELDILASYRSILRDMPSELDYEALEESTVFMIDYPVIRKLSADDTRFAQALITLLEQLLMESFERLKRFLLLSARDRYIRLLDEKPEIMHRVPQKLLASYIGITPVSLSRLRKQLAEEGQHG